MAEWRALLDADSSKAEPNLIDVEYTTNLNPFGDFAVLEIDDFDGSRYDEYRKGRRVDIESKPSGGSFSTQMPGYVVNRREHDEAGANRVSVELYSLGHLLSRGDIREDLSDQTLESAMQTVIENYTPVAWNASNVDIQNSQTITRNFLYGRVDDVLEEMAAMSANEEYGVNQSGEFFFRPRESKKVSRGIKNKHFDSFDVEEKSAELTNVIRTYYGGGDKAVTVSDDKSRKELQDELGTTDPVSFPESKTNQDIAKQDDARSFGNVQLEDKSATDQRTAVTYGLLDAEPGDTIDVTVPAAGINGEFLIAEINYVWGTDDTRVTLVDVTGNQDNIIKRISDTLKRVEMRPSVSAADLELDVRVLETEVVAELEVTGDIGGEPLLEDSIVVNEGLRQLRDSWGDASSITVSKIKIGSGGSIPSRTDTGLESSSEEEGVTITTPESDEAEFTNDTNFSQSLDVSEVGLFDGSGNLLVRGRIDGAVSGPDTATVNIRCNDFDDDKSLITNVGQTLTRDIWADNSPDHVDRIALGSGTADPAEGDTALTTSEATRSITNQFIASTSAWFENAQDNLGDNDPVNVIASGSDQKIEHLQSSFSTEGENLVNPTGSVTTVSNSDYSNGSGATLSSETYGVKLTFPYRIPDANASIAIRGQIVSGGSGTTTLEAIQNGQVIGSVDIETTLQWYTATLSSTNAAIDGEETLAVRKEGSGDDVNIDVFTAFDDRHHTASSFDNANGGSGGGLDTPANFASQTTVNLGDETVSASVTEGEIDSTWNDTTNSQFIELEGSQSTNTADDTFSFSAANALTPKIALSRFGSASGSKTPQTGANGQECTDFDVAAGLGGAEATDINAIDISASFPAGTFSGTNISEMAQKTASGDIATHSVFAAATLESNQQAKGVSNISWVNAGRAINTAYYEVDDGTSDSESGIDESESGGIDSGTITGTDYFRVVIVRTEVG